jgi:hypothetical protein
LVRRRFKPSFPAIACSGTAMRSFMSPLPTWRNAGLPVVTALVSKVVSVTPGIPTTHPGDCRWSAPPDSPTEPMIGLKSGPGTPSSNSSTTSATPSLGPCTLPSASKRSIA